MSGTSNEFEEPGGNYPDSQKQEAPVQSRSDAGTDGAVADDAGLAGDARPPAAAGTQDGPVLAQNEPTELERLDGIVVQTRADLAGEDVATVERSLRRRLSDAGIALDEQEIEALARDLSNS